VEQHRSSIDPRCAVCQEPRTRARRCHRCGTFYPAAETRWTGVEDDARLERRLRQIVPPLAFVVAYLVMQVDGLRAVFRLVTMWVHEIGHAAAGLLCGFSALPGPWRTAMSTDRRVGVVIVLCAFLIGPALLSWYRHRRATATVILCGGVLLLHLALTLGPSAHDARAFFTFAGDAGMMVFGALLAATFHAPPGSKLHRDWLRWGFLAIGALAFMDAFVTWSDALRDPESIAFGNIEGVGDSDPTVLVDRHGWSISQLVSRYRAVGWFCLAALAGWYAWNWWRDHQASAQAAADSR
jgi:Peptidase M50B-like